MLSTVKFRADERPGWGHLTVLGRLVPLGVELESGLRVSWKVQQPQVQQKKLQPEQLDPTLDRRSA